MSPRGAKKGYLKNQKVDWDSLPFQGRIETFPFLLFRVRADKGNYFLEPLATALGRKSAGLGGGRKAEPGLNSPSTTSFSRTPPLLSSPVSRPCHPRMTLGLRKEEGRVGGHFPCPVPGVCQWQGDVKKEGILRLPLERREISRGFGKSG